MSKVTKIKIMIAEDHADLGAFLETVLTMAGLETVLVRDGIEALETIREQRPDVLLTDIEMPGKDGITLIKEVREQEAAENSLKHLPIVVMSGRSDKFRDALKIGAAFCVPKPFADLSRVIDKIRELIHSPLMRDSVCTVV